MMMNLLWVAISVVIAMPFVLAVLNAELSVEQVYGRKPHGHFHDIPNGQKILPTWAGVFMVFMILGWKIGIMFWAASFLINMVVSEVSCMIKIHHYRGRYMKMYITHTVVYWVACITCYVGT
jgi:hypothetical protein